VGQGDRAPEEIRFLQGPQPRAFDLARAVRIFFEFLRGFRVLHWVGPCVTVFGSARFKGEVFLRLHRASRRLRNARRDVRDRHPGADRQVKEFPIVLMGREYWRPLTDFVRNQLLVVGTIDPGDEQRLQVTDSPEEAVDLVAGVAMRRFGLGYGPQARRRWYLGE